MKILHLEPLPYRHDANCWMNQSPRIDLKGAVRQQHKSRPAVFSPPFAPRMEDFAAYSRRPHAQSLPRTDQWPRDNGHSLRRGNGQVFEGGAKPPPVGADGWIKGKPDFIEALETRVAVTDVL